MNSKWSHSNIIFIVVFNVDIHKIMLKYNFEFLTYIKLKSSQKCEIKINYKKPYYHYTFKQILYNLLNKIKKKKIKIKDDKKWTGYNN